MGEEDRRGSALLLHQVLEYAPFQARSIPCSDAAVPVCLAVARVGMSLALQLDMNSAGSLLMAHGPVAGQLYAESQVV